MRVTFEPVARDEIERLFAWIAQDNPRAALDMVERIEQKIMRLARPGFALMGRPGTVEGTRELIEPPYVIVYRVDREHDAISVLGIMHGARDRTR